VVWAQAMFDNSHIARWLFCIFNCNTCSNETNVKSEQNCIF